MRTQHAGLKKQDKDNVIKTSGAIRKMKNHKRSTYNSVKDSWLCRICGYWKMWLQNANPTHRNLCTDRKMFVCSYSAILFQFTLRVSRLIIILISYLRLFDWCIDINNSYRSLIILWFTYQFSVHKFSPKKKTLSKTAI